ncbi:LL-diaminopimelate aminotransferase [Neomoorella thermoacetica]|uniref:LL-diaminopimelate aminotransferase n=3 Tax=Neomoorella thermoacetica TaxID=1525 RepID=DAPAT_MOOTA|nr:LL-diaminopimelate aminotransferase [Moorella thermoacetica]Q2RK33.1 RecName: Full=LL-diaminopimelate aminotransferase; Short=DAP-AT; Short=DAP-aminotransferase; Short=LL-DAP-aminotransferase [Moorella thermoacetica ATCC 39073]AKX93642.1 LL-diaminopimelate aminotransferase [Moorella thermoacetica]AKX96288.1 LL-diaminopimelate aminotransferase [Moorella thermoacetica]AOQ23555.1 LL-diaminopimelate aminotransferase [Moorella thermoacetica]APC08011.1 LL-diaminopimelate aminotransferase [Moorell
MQEARRIRELPPYLFARIEKKIAEARERGVDIISLGIGDPDMPTPSHVIDKLVAEAHNPENHRYPTSEGLLAFRQAVADWYQRLYGVDLDPRREVVTLIGSKEGIAHISLCYVDPGDINLVPDPGYPVYNIGTLLAGGESYFMPLTAANGFLPDLGAIPSDVARRAKLMFINYPNNPTGAVADLKFFQEVVEFARSYDLIVCHDAAYSEITYDGYRAPSFLQAPGAKEVGIEFNSVSKPYNMTGWRLGWACGRADVIEALARIKSNIDSGAFQAVQYAGIAALTGPQEGLAEVRRVYQERRDIIVEGFNSLGWHLEKPKATFYVWAPVPRGYTSASFAEMVLEKAGVIITPGNGYGNYGEGYFRIALTISKERMQEAIERLRRVLGKVEF